MSIKDDVLDALSSDEGQELLKKAADGALLDALSSDEGQKALKKAADEAVRGVLKSGDGQNALRGTVQAELEEGFASHAPTLTGDAKKKVGTNQQWLFDTVEKIRVKVRA